MPSKICSLRNLAERCPRVIASGDVDAGEFARHLGRIAYQLIESEELPIVTAAQS